jgi:hypothetical protein
LCVPPIGFTGPLGSVRNCGDRATASIDDIWCENGGCRGSGYALLNVRYARLCAWERASRVIRDRIEPAASPGMVGFVAESRTELSCGHATGSNTIPETVTVDGPPVAKGAATVSASTLALHLDCSRTYIAKLGAEGAIQRQSDAFPLDRSRVAYLRYLRRERHQSPRSEADADHVKSVDQRSALPDQCLHLPEADVRPPKEVRVWTELWIQEPVILTVAESSPAATSPFKKTS